MRFRAGDAAELPAGAYDAVFLFECVHDMPRPVEVLAAARRALAPGRSAIVMDEAVAETFTAPGDELERLMYGFSLLICLPDGMSHPPSAATGTVMRPETLRGYAEEAGFTGLEVLSIKDFGFWRFYELTTRSADEKPVDVTRTLSAGRTRPPAPSRAGPLRNLPVRPAAARPAARPGSAPVRRRPAARPG